MRAAALRAALVVATSAVWSARGAAQDAAEVTPRSTVEVGVGDVSTGSFKAGEYNGLEKKGAFLVGNVDLHGGAPYDSGKGLRWRITGTDLGLETRSVTAEIGVQGRFRLNFGYDELLRNRSDSYQTPYNGAGSNVLTLPGTWLVPTVAGSSATSAAVNTVSARGLVNTIGDAHTSAPRQPLRVRCSLRPRRRRRKWTQLRQPTSRFSTTSTSAQSARATTSARITR